MNRLKFIFTLVVIILILSSNLINAQISDSTGYNSYISLADKKLKTGNTDEAIRYYLKAADILEKENNTQMIAQVYVKIADIYENIGADENAIDYYQKASENTGKNDNTQLFIIKEKLGDTYLKTHNPNKALEQFLYMANYYNQTKQTQDLIKISEKISQAFRADGEFQKSLETGKNIILIVKNNIRYPKYIYSNHNTLFIKKL